jgi:plasmid stabilization system protein ParE
MVIKHRYCAYYMVTPIEVVVVRVLHEARDVDAISNDAGFEE